MTNTTFAQAFLALMTLSLGLAACAATPSTPWQKPGADEATKARDTSECRASAEQEALRRYPHGFSSPSFGPSGTVMSQQRDNTNRAVAETGFFDSCMQNRGYTRASTPEK